MLVWTYPPSLTASKVSRWYDNHNQRTQPFTLLDGGFPENGLGRTVQAWD